MIPDAIPSPLILGCMNLGGSWTDEKLTPDAITNTQDCVRTAIDEGISVFDHADIYCWGKSEEAFGHIWSDLGIHRDSVVLQTKCGIRRSGDPTPDAPHRFDLSYDHITSSVHRSLERLKTDYVDILLLHRGDVLMEPEEVSRAFTDLRDQGLVWQFGVSNFNASHMELLQAHLSDPLVADQLEFNVLHSDLIDEGVTMNNTAQRLRSVADGTLEYCQRKDIVVQAYSPIAKGSLTPLVDDTDERLKEAAAVVTTMAEAKRVSPEAIMGAWILRHPAGIRPVIGTTRPGRIRSIAAAVGVNLTREEWYTLYLAGRGRDIP